MPRPRTLPLVRVRLAGQQGPMSRVRDAHHGDTCMKRHLLNLVTAVSLLLCVATVVLWVRSYWVGDRVSWARGGRVDAVYSGAGGFGVSRITNGSGARGVRWNRVDTPPYPFTHESPP